MHSDTTHMHNENSYLESPNPLFSNMYILKPDSARYEYNIYISCKCPYVDYA